MKFLIILLLSVFLIAGVEHNPVTFKNTVTFDDAGVSNTELSYVDGVTSSIQSQISAITGLPSGTNGDVLYFNGTWQVLAKGSDSEVLTLASGVPSWAAGVTASVTLLASQSVGSVGDVSQIQAGHIFATDEGGVGTDLALYLFATGALTTDEEGAYTLTNQNAVIECDGILGSKNCAEFTGANYFTNGTLLDTTPAAIAIDYWVLPADGQPAANEFLIQKDNIAGTDRLRNYLGTDGVIYCIFEQNNTSVTLMSATILTNGAQTDWVHVVLAWDTTYGVRMFINEVQEAVDSSQTTLMQNGTADGFHIGALEPDSSHFTGKISMVRVRNQVLEQRDVDLAYASKVDISGASFSDTDFQLWGIALAGGSSNFASQVILTEVQRTTSNIYLYGKQFDPSDHIKLIGRE